MAVKKELCHVHAGTAVPRLNSFDLLFIQLCLLALL
jgi:hypothetical protein